MKSCRNCDWRSTRYARRCERHGATIPDEFYNQYKNECPDWIEEVPF
jgi:hypothetical protein